MVYRTKIKAYGFFECFLLQYVSTKYAKPITTVKFRRLLTFFSNLYFISTPPSYITHVMTMFLYIFHIKVPIVIVIQKIICLYFYL